jgi:cell division protein FtsN
MTQAGERLPWLTDEPAKATPAAPAAARRSPAGRKAPSMWPWYLLLALLVAAVAGGAWWLGTRQKEAPPPQLPAEEPVAIPVAEAPGPGEPLPPPAPAPAEQAAPTPSAPPATSAPPRPRPERRRDSSPAPEREREQAPRRAGRSVFPADEPVTAAPPPLTGPAPVIVYHPQKNRGRVVQLGAFPTREQAEAAWRRLTRRYPYLATKPKMVNTVDVRALGGGRRTRMYRLQLGTSSQAQSAVICQQLERAGQSCVVVY